MPPTTEQLRALLVQTDTAIKAAHFAYTIALKNKQEEGDTKRAFATLCRVNEVRNTVYEMLNNSI